MFKGTGTPIGGSTSYFQIIGGLGDHEETWGPSRGISVNDPQKQMGTTTVGLGEILTVRTYSGSSWRLAGSIILEAKNQTLRV